jgi:hypothetical protein
MVKSALGEEANRSRQANWRIFEREAGSVNRGKCHFVGQGSAAGGAPGRPTVRSSGYRQKRETLHLGVEAVRDECYIIQEGVIV